MSYKPERLLTQPAEAIVLTRGRPFPHNKRELNASALYDAAAFFYFSPRTNELFQHHLQIQPITDEMMEGLEAYKPPTTPLVARDPRRMQALREIRYRQKLASAHGLVEVINHRLELAESLSELRSRPGDPEYEFTGFLQQFKKDSDKAYQLERVFNVLEHSLQR